MRARAGVSARREDLFFKRRDIVDFLAEFLGFHIRGEQNFCLGVFDAAPKRLHAEPRVNDGRNSKPLLYVYYHLYKLPSAVTQLPTYSKSGYRATDSRVTASA